MKRNRLTAIKTFVKDRPWISFAIKLAVTIICLWYVSRKINWLLTLQLLNDSNKWWLLLAAGFFTLSKLVAAFRLNIYFKNIDVRLAQTDNIKLYWLGMFYNLFLPGGIGGDAYKVLVLNRRNMQSVKKLSAAVLLDRISGVAGLAILVAIYYFLIFKGSQYSWWLLLAIAPGLVVYYFFIKKVFYSFISSCWITLLLGIIVQFLQVVCVYCLLSSIHITQHHNEFVLLFLLSSIVAILPFTIGGLGAREVVFLWGSQQFGLNTNESIFISVLFYIITVCISFIGIRWVYKEPLRPELQ